MIYGDERGFESHLSLLTAKVIKARKRDLQEELFFTRKFKWATNYEATFFTIFLKLIFY